MAKNELTVTDPSGKNFEAAKVELIESVERFSELKLDDGTILKVKPNVTQIVRLLDHWDAEGKPIYIVSSNAIVLISSCPDDLIKRG